MKKDFKSGLIVFIILLVVIAAVTVGSFFIPKDFFNNEGTTYSKTYEKSYKGEYVGLLYITGTIQEENDHYNNEWILNTIRKLKNDSNNVGLALYLNTPGGAVYQADQVYLALLDYKAAGKPIYAYMGPMAASGGYYIACAADKIWANRNTLTGSIGVIAGQSFDLTDMFDNIGIKSETIHAGKNKNMMNYNEPFTAEQKEIMQSIADECYEQFCQIVAESRKMPLSKVYPLADGRVYTAKQAFTNGLIDNVDSLDNMLDRLSSSIERPNIKVKTYIYEGKKGLMNYLIGKAKVFNTSVTATKLGLPEKVLNDLNNSDLYPAYLYK